MGNLDITASGEPLATNDGARAILDDDAGSNIKAANENHHAELEDGDAAMPPQSPVHSRQGTRLLDALVRHAERDAGQLVITCIADGQSPRTRRFAVTNTSAAMAFAGEMNRTGYNAYWGAALMPLDLRPGARGEKKDIRAVLAMVIDLDTQAAAACYERGEFPLGLQPSFVVETSRTPHRRYQIGYLFKEPEQDVAAVEDRAARLELAWGGDWCSKDAAHIWRIPGMINYPDEKKRREGRIEEPAELIACDEERRYDLSDFDDLPEPPRTQATAELPAMDMSAAPICGGVAEVIARLPAYIRQEIEGGHVPLDRSAFDFRLCKEAVKAGLSLADVLSLYDWGTATGQPFAGKHADRADDYLRRTFDKAAVEAATERSTPSDTQGNPAGEDAPNDLFRLMGFDDLDNLPPAVWLVAYTVLVASLVLVYAPQSQGKTFVVLDMLLRIAYGLQWNGRDVNRGATVYIAGEGHAGLRKRIAAWRKIHGKQHEDAPFKLLPTSVDLLDMKEADRLVRSIRAAFPPGTPIAAIAIDTLSRCFAGGDENTAKDMNTFVRACDYIREQTGATVYIVHHTGKERERGSRGSSALPANVDTAIEVKAADTHITLRFEKQKDVEAGDPIHMRLVPVEIINPSTGEVETSCVVEPSTADRFAGSTASNDNEPKLGRHQNTMLSIIRNAGPNGMSNQDWHQRAKQAGVSREATFYDAKKALIGHGLVIEDNGTFRAA